MKCTNCGDNNTTVFFVETIPCLYCDKDNEVTYNLCKKCGLVWKSLGDKVLDGAILPDPEVGQIIGDVLDRLEIMKETEPKNSMKEFIHKCLRCGTMSFEISPKLYHCPDCGFEWEVI